MFGVYGSGFQHTVAFPNAASKAVGYANSTTASGVKPEAGTLT